MRLLLFPSDVIFLKSITLPSSQSNPASERASLAAFDMSEKTAVTEAFSHPVRTRFLVVRFPSTAPRASIRMDLPAPVSPVSTQKPLSNSISANSITAMFSIRKVSSIMPSLQKEMSIIENNILGCFELTDRFLKARKEAAFRKTWLLKSPIRRS